jgi:hypothetical protein
VAAEAVAAAGAEGAAGSTQAGAAPTGRRLPGAALHSPLQLSKVLPPTPAASANAQQHHQQQQQQQPMAAGGVTPAGKAVAGTVPQLARTPVPPWVAGTTLLPQAVTPAAAPGSAFTTAAAVAASAAAGCQAGTPATAAAATGPGCITEQAVLQVLWQGRSSGPELIQKLGATTPQQTQQLQQVLEGLVASGEQVLATPACSKVDVRNADIRFIAF